MEKRHSNPRRFLKAEEVQRIEAAVAEAGKLTSSQIKFVIARHCWLGLRRKGARLFRRMGLDRSEQRSGVMILLVTANRQFLVYGDRGAHAKVGNDFWRGLSNTLQDRFRQGAIVEALCEVIGSIGRELAGFFPREKQGDELPNQIVYCA